MNPPGGAVGSPPSGGVDVPAASRRPAPTAPPARAGRDPLVEVRYADAPDHDVDRVHDAAELVPLSTREPLPAAPGQTVHHSDYLRLGLLLEQVTGSSFADLLGEQITGPPELGSTTVSAETVPGWGGRLPGESPPP